MENVNKRGRKLKTEDPYFEKIRQKLFKIRTNKGISQKEVGISAGLSNAAYSNIEAGISQNLTIKAGIGIAKVLDVNFTELFEIEDSTSENTGLEKRISELEEKIDLLEKQISEKDLLIEMFKNERVRISKDILGFLEECFEEQVYEIDKTSSMPPLAKKDVINMIQRKMKSNAMYFFIKTNVIDKKDLDKILADHKSSIRPAEPK